MGNYTKTITSIEPSTEFYRKIYILKSDWSVIQNDSLNGSFTFNLPDLTGSTITGISISATAASTQSQGGYGDYNVKVGGTTVAAWNDSAKTSWEVTDLNLQGGRNQTVSLALNALNWDGATVPRHSNSLEHAYMSYTGRSYGRATLVISYSAEFTETTIAPLSGTAIPKSVATEFSWAETLIEGSVASKSLFWKQDEDDSYTEIVLDTDATTYTFPANSFELGSISWYVSAEDDAGNIVTSSVETVTVGIVPSVSISYPVGINIKSSNAQIFTWEMQEEIATGQYSYEIRYKEAEDADWTTVTAVSGDQYHTFAANTFPAGDYVWELKVTNNDGLSTGYAGSTFTAIGATDAPVITGVTNSSIPTITWTVTSQDTFEVEIYKGQECVYMSGVQVGHDVRSFTPNIILADGNYIIKMRAMNDYGFFTPWLDYSFVLAPEHPDPLDCYVFANETSGVTIARSLELDAVTPSIPVEFVGVPTAYYVIRRRVGETDWKILGKLDINDESVKYEDNTVISGETYEYAIRNYESEKGYTDSNIVQIEIDFQGFIISSGKESVQLFLSESSQFEMTHSAVKEQTYSFMIGRKYPVKEASEWVSITDSFSCFADQAQYEKLLSFYEGNADLWLRGTEFSYQCSIDSLVIKETLWGRGYELSIALSRTDEEELRLF